MPIALPKKEVALLVVGVSSPLLAGIYEKGRLIERFRSEEKSSVALPPLLYRIRNAYDLRALYYAKGPGSFMAIKVTYVMLKTFSIALEIPLYASDAFAFNGGEPIKALGRSCFVKREGEIVIESGCEIGENLFKLPDKLDMDRFSMQNEPLYILPAV